MSGAQDLDSRDLDQPSSRPGEPRLRSLAIVGLGLIGSSIALAARRRWKLLHIVGVDKSAEATDHPLVAATCNDTSTEVDGIRGVDLIVLALPVSAIVDRLPQVMQLADAGALVMDTGSTKRAVMTAARDLGVRHFIGGHPMAGGTAPGAGAARADLFDARAWFLVEGEVDDERRILGRHFVDGLGATPVSVDAAWHDRTMAALSHLPQVTAAALMKVAGEAAGEHDLAWGGRGLRDTTRLASSPASTWSSILESNAEYLRPLLLQLSDELRAMANQLQERKAVERLFDAANEWKTKLGA